MKLGPVAKLDKRNKTTSKKFGDDVMSVNCDVIVIFLIHGQFGVSVELAFSLTVIFYLTKSDTTKNSLTQLSHYFFE